MPSNVTRDHHRWTRDINAPQNTEIDVTGTLTLDVSGDIIADVGGGQFTIQDNTSGDPDLIINNTTDDDNGGTILFRVNRDGEGTTVGQDDDALGTILWQGYNSVPALTNFASVRVEIKDVTDATEAGTLLLGVMTKDASPTGSAIQTGLSLEGTDTNDEVDVTIGSGANSLTTLAGNLDIDGDTITSAGDITLDSGGEIFLDSHNGLFKFYDAGDSDDYFGITVVGGTGAVTLRTISEHSDGHINIAPQGHVEFDGCGVGFDKETVAFSADPLVNGGGDTTNIDFRIGNKQELILIDNLAGGGEDLIMIFPATSGNFILVLCQDSTGSRTIAADAWRAHAADLSEGDNTLGANLTDGDVRWAGGTAPTLSTGAKAIDIISIYWDADNQTALAMASLGFE